MTGAGGAVRSEVMLKVASRFGLPLESCATPAGTLTITKPSAVGVTSKVYVWALTITKFDAVPFMICKSVTSNPVTSSSKVTVNGMGERLVGS